MLHSFFSYQVLSDTTALPEGNVEDEVSILGALFQAGLFIMLGAMQSASTLLSDRVICYKQMDANFFSSWPYILGRTLAGFPQVR